MTRVTMLESIWLIGRRIAGMATFPDLSLASATGYRVHSPFAPDRGLRCNPAKLLLDLPYARAIKGGFISSPALHAYELGRPTQDLSQNDADGAPFMPRAIVTNPQFDWGDDRPLRTSSHDTIIIYEVQVKGFTARYPDIPPDCAGPTLD